MNILGVETNDREEYNLVIDELKRTLDYNDIPYEESYDRLGCEAGVILQPKELLQILNYLSME